MVVVCNLGFGDGGSLMSKLREGHLESAVSWSESAPPPTIQALTSHLSAVGAY